MTRLALLVGLLGCGPSSNSAPAKGTAADPVLVCERFGDVCKLDSSRLGVCSPESGSTKLACTPQH